jgi:hypothetical protein
MRLGALLAFRRFAKLDVIQWQCIAIGKLKT